ncbi:MAG: prolipoprotein diacylglyceryl transferase [Clostridia bacterium]
MSTISFPNLFGGLDIKVSRIAFTLFGIEVYWYGLIIGIAFCLAVLLVLRDIKKYQIKEDDIINLLLFAVPVAIIFARLFYVLFFSGKTWTFVEMLNIRDGGLAIYGAIIGGLLTGFIYAKIKKINFLDMADLALPYLALAQAIGRWGNFVNQEAFGTNTTLPWGMTSLSIQNEIVRLNAFEGMSLNPNIPVHPTFLYESLWSFAVFILLYALSRNRKFRGQIFCLYMATYGIGRMFIEGLRTDSLMLGNIRISQLLGLVFFIVFGGVVAYIYLTGRKVRKETEETQELETGKSEYSEILSKKIVLSPDEKRPETEAEPKDETDQETGKE